MKDDAIVFREFVSTKEDICPSLLVPSNYKAFYLTRERGTNQPQCENAQINPARILILAKARKKTPAKKGALQ